MNKTRSSSFSQIDFKSAYVESRKLKNIDRGKFDVVFVQNI